MNHREVLGVGADASKSEIKRAYRKAAKELHPDLSKSPEAAEAFTRIKQAHDALLSEAEAPRESTGTTTAAARAAAATAQAAYSTQDDQAVMTDEELAHVQEMDEIIQHTSHGPFFKKSKESAEIKRHRKKIKTNNRRMRGLY